MLICTCTHTHTHLCTHTHMCVHTCTHAYMNTYAHTCMHTRLCVYRHIMCLRHSILVYIHTHITLIHITVCILYRYLYIHTHIMYVCARVCVYKEPPCQCRRHRFDPWVRKMPWREGHATHSSILAWEKNPMDRGARRVTVHGVTEDPDMT